MNDISEADLARIEAYCEGEIGGLYTIRVDDLKVLVAYVRTLWEALEPLALQNKSGALDGHGDAEMVLQVHGCPVLRAGHIRRAARILEASHDQR